MSRAALAIVAIVAVIVAVGAWDVSADDDLWDAMKRAVHTAFCAIGDGFDRAARWLLGGNEMETNDDR